MIYAVANQKGGQGKSTTAQAIINGCTARGLKTLAIDLDPQANLTFSMNGNGSDKGTYELITGQAKPGEVIQKTAQGDIITASLALASADTTFTGNSRIYSLRDAIKPIKSKYDVIVIDCPPTLNTLLINALAAADGVIIPLTAEMYSLQGLYLLIDTIKGVKEKYNKRLEICGVLFVKHNTRTVLTRELTDVIRQQCEQRKINIFDATIRESVSIREAQLERQDLLQYAPKSKPAQDYTQFVNELLERN